MADAVMPSEAGFDIIAGKSGSASLSTLDTTALADLRDQLVQLARSYDKLIIDLGAGVDAVVRTFSAAAGVTLVVTNDESTALTADYAFIKQIGRAACRERGCKYV